MRKPVFNETLQLAIVVRDPDATMGRFVDDCRVGPWQIYEFDAGKAEDFREYGRPVERSCRPGVATVGQVQWAAEPGSAMTRVARPTSVFRTTSDN